MIGALRSLAVSLPSDCTVSSFDCTQIAKRWDVAVSVSGRDSGFSRISLTCGRKNPFRQTWKKSFGSQNCRSLDFNSAISTSARTEGEESKIGNDLLQFEHEVSLFVDAPPELVWTLWTDLERVPQWMSWIQRVEVLGDGAMPAPHQMPLQENSLSRWVCNTRGFEVAWVAKVEGVDVACPHWALRWSTVEGLQSSGQVKFSQHVSGTGTTVELSIRHSLPPALGAVLTRSVLSSLVQATLNSDLQRFQVYALKCLEKQAQGEEKKSA
eukprot:TRINITY_DN15965_c0_g1_i1.p1 TRINITY_DN15965_c0_g1~~TRINITY_DN15965_c0_g1_i1.p1  ORF type:complete len:268 (+),score=24.67 TRINITY_DN15965_c0_g1_i1:82-885(+)